VNNPRYRNVFIYVLVGIAILVVTLTFWGNNGTSAEISLSELVQDINRNEVDNILVRDNELTVRYTNGTTATTRKDPSLPAPEQLISLGADPERLQSVEINNGAPSNVGAWFGILINILPLLLLGGFIYLMLRQAQGSNNQALSFGKSRARMFSSDQPTVTFADVAGVEEAKEELQEVVEFLKEPEKFIQLGARIPKGVLLVGSPGTGKTLLAKAVAGEAGVPFFSISGSEFVEMFVGVGASRVRDLFDQAKKHSPCIIFVDEIDAVGRHRGAGLGGSHDEREQTLNQILVEMDGFDTDTNVIVVAATNRPDILDPALMRPGRFDRRVVLDRPDLRGREAILKVHVKGKPLSNDVDLSVLAKSTPGFVGADIENLVNEAAIVAARKNKKSIAQRDFEEAVERVVLGPERKSRIITERERRLVAYHEAGHAIAFHLLPYSDPVRKVTIVPRGMAGGVTWSMPAEDINYITASRLRDQIAGALGGRAAEELVFGEVTTGAMSDLDQVAKIARSMVKRYGMSDKLGPIIFGQKEELVFLGREIGEQRDYSEHVAEEIDAEVSKIVNIEYDRVKNLLAQHHDKLDILVERLLEVETVNQEEFLEMMGEKAVPEHDPYALPAGSKHETQASQGDEGEAASNLGTAPSPAR
jgi:cell division protease FtsH